jgi:hypothetical protein
MNVIGLNGNSAVGAIGENVFQFGRNLRRAVGLNIFLMSSPVEFEGKRSIAIRLWLRKVFL